MDAFETGWVAGLFEGEGTIVLNGSDRRRRVRVAVGSTDHDVLVRLQALAGGKLNGPYSRGPNKPIWHWRIDKQAEVEAFLRLVVPHLCSRRRVKAEEALATIARWHGDQAEVWAAAAERNKGFTPARLALA